jgi:hypothetical protein
VCPCDEQADLTNPDFIPIHTQGPLVLLYIAAATYAAFHFISCMICFGFLAGVGWVFIITIITILFFKNCCSHTSNHPQEELAKLGI